MKLILFLFLISLIFFSCKNKIVSKNEVLSTSIENKSKFAVKDSNNWKYNKSQILDTISKLLNKLIPAYRESVSAGFYVGDTNICGGFFVYDLTDTINNSITKRESFNFIDNHIYHFAPTTMTFSYSNILVLVDGNINIFKGINCEKGDNVKAILNYIYKNYSLRAFNKDIEYRIMNIRKYGRYIQTDVHSTVNCNYFIPN